MNSQLNPQVSVVVASYNHENYVEAALLSVLNQTCQDFEIIVVDDGSADATPERVRAVNDPRIRLTVFEQNKGACIAMNHAIRQARGEFIAVLNSDDLFMPEKLEMQLAFLRAHRDIDAVFAYPALIDESGQPFTEEGHKDTSVFQVENRARTAWLRHFFDRGNCLCHPSLMIRKSCYDSVGLYDARLAQVPDLDMWIRLCMKHTIHVLPEPLTQFRIRANQQNASAGRPEVIIRDAWERRHILDHYLRLPPADFVAVFPEYAGRKENMAQLLAERALSLSAGLPFYAAFALDTLFQALPPNGDSPAYRAFLDLTGRQDIYRLRPLKES